MSKRTRILRRLGGAILLAAMVLPAALPAVAEDEQPGAGRWADDPPVVVAPSLDRWRFPRFDPTGVEWS